MDEKKGQFREFFSELPLQEYLTWVFQRDLFKTYFLSDKIFLSNKFFYQL